MTWRKDLPTLTTKVRSSPAFFVDNWDALEAIIGVEHYTFTDTLAGHHKAGSNACVYVGTQTNLLSLWTAPPTGSLAIVTDPTSGALRLFVCTSSVGSGTWTDYTPSHLFAADLACGDPHSQYLNKSQSSTISGSITITGSLSVSGIISSTSLTAVRELTFCVPGDVASGDLAPWLHVPFSGYLGSVIGVVKVASTVGFITVDILQCTDPTGVGPTFTTIFSGAHKLTIDQDERSSESAASASTLSSTTFGVDDYFRINIDGAGSGASDLTVGLKVIV